jgi:hypothetical protein
MDSVNTWGGPSDVDGPLRFRVEPGRYAFAYFFWILF